MHLPLPQHVHMEESILLPAVVHVNHVVDLSNLLNNAVSSLLLCCQLVSCAWEEDQHLIS